MIQEHATAADFTRWREQAERMTMAELYFAAADCRKAESFMRGWNPIREGYYSDQACTFGDEIRRRKSGL
jgi:hypothetical protein